jgi:hypothetical protein
MNEISRTEKWLEKAYELAFFIHGDVEIAKQIAFNAMNKLEVASNAQYKRFYYTPGARNTRNKVSMNDLQLLQRLVYVESEAFEKEKEFTDRATERDLLIYFIKHLIRITLKRNSFYVTLGLSRILHNYGTTEAMEIYNVVVQDPDRVHDDYYYRSRKSILMKELKKRFDEKLEIAQLNRGEQRFQSAGYSPSEAELVKSCLQSFTPWNTGCDLPEKFNPHLETIKALCFTGSYADDEHRVELNRMHVLLNPETFQKVVDALRFPRPDEKLEIPRFHMKKKTDDSGDKDDSQQAPPLDEDELRALAVRLDQEAARRKTASCGYFRVLIDGEEAGIFDSLATPAHRVEFDREFSELIEVYSVENGRDTLLATYLMGGDDEFEKTSLVLENGQQITFAFDAFGCQIGYRETDFRRRWKCWWKRQVGHPGAGAKFGRPALASLGLAIILSVGLIAFFGTNGENQPVVATEPENTKTISGQYLLAEDPGPARVTPQPVTVKKTLPGTEKERADVVAPSPRTIREGDGRFNGERSAARRTPRRTTVEKNDDLARVQKFPVIENREDSSEIASDATRSVKESGKTIAEIRYLYIEVSGDERFGRQIGKQLMDQINANKRFLAVNNKEKADGLLKVAVRREHDNAGDEQTIVTATVRLVNAEGFVIFPNRKKVSAWRYVGPATGIPARVVRELTLQRLRQSTSRSAAKRS